MRKKCGKVFNFSSFLRRLERSQNMMAFKNVAKLSIFTVLPAWKDLLWRKSLMNIRNGVSISVFPFPFKELNLEEKTMSVQKVAIPSFLSYIFQNVLQCTLEIDMFIM
jgi:hypothetical protein